MNATDRYCLWCMGKLPAGAAVCPRCADRGSPENDPHQLPAGTTLAGRYLVGHMIGEGGFGITYAGRDLKLDMPVAIKEYYPSGQVNRYHTVSLEVTANRSEAASFSAGKERFIEEAHVLAKFASEPHIVCIRDLFEGNNTAYIVMEYLQGQSLREVSTQEGPIPFDRLMDMMLPVIADLSKVHRQGLIHRDITPSNLMLLEDGTVKLLDFGTARAFEVNSERGLSVILKPGYAPEEQYRSHGDQGPWTDVYALCATLYKLNTGKTPENSMNRLCQDTLQAPSSLGAVISPRQERVLMKGLSVKREDRYQTAEDLRSAFLSATAAMPSGASGARAATKAAVLEKTVLLADTPYADDFSDAVRTAPMGRLTAERPTMDRSTVDRPTAERPTMDRPSGDHPAKPATRLGFYTAGDLT